MSFLKRLFGGEPTAAPVTTRIEAATFKGRRRHLEVVGEYYHQPAFKKVLGADAKEGANVTTVATLVPDPSNKHDSNAVRIIIEGQLVGHLSREQAAGFHAAMTAAGYPGGAVGNVEARIFGRPLDSENHGGFGVAIYLPEELAKQIGYGERF